MAAPYVMSSAAVRLFLARVETFTTVLGLRPARSEAMAEKLVICDREGDDRRLCLECVHLYGTGKWNCTNWRQAGVPAGALATGLMVSLQRCGGFEEMRNDLWTDWRQAARHRATKKRVQRAGL